MVDAFLPSASILSVCIFPSHKKHFYQILDYMHIFEIYSTFNNPTWKLIRIFCMCEESRTHLLPLISVFCVGIHSFLSILSCLYRIIIPREKKKKLRDRKHNCNYAFELQFYHVHTEVWINNETGYNSPRLLNEHCEMLIIISTLFNC